MAEDHIARALKNINSAISDLKSNVTDLKSNVTDLKSNVTDLKSNVTDLKSEMSAGFKRVDTELNAAKIRDEEMLGKMKLGLEGLEGHRESTDAGFERMSSEHREQTDLLKGVLVHVRRRVERVEARKPRRRRS
jgi:septal ring factor EnvC (AmiA/AmiB activator)